MEECIIIKEITNLFIDPENSISPGPDHTSNAAQSVPEWKPSLSENTDAVLGVQRALANTDHSSGSSSEDDVVNLDSGAKSEPNDQVASPNKTDADEGAVGTDAKVSLLCSDPQLRPPSPHNAIEIAQTDDDDSQESSSTLTFDSSRRDDDVLWMPLLQVDNTYRLIPRLNLSMPIDVPRESQPLRPSVMEQMVNLLQDGSKWDVKVYVGQHKFHCHMCVLQAYSPYFRRSKVEDTYVFRLPTDKVTAQSFNIIYKWMLYDEAPLRKRYSNRCLMEIYSTAKCLGIEEVIEAVWDLLERIKKEHEDFTMLPDMNHLNMATFEFVCFTRISRFFLTLVASLEFVQLDLETVCQLLSSHSVGVNSEAEILYSAVRWLSYKWPERRPHVVVVMRCVRFELLSPLFLRYLQGEQTTRVMHCISNHAEIQETINKAFIYASSELFFKDPMQPLPFPLPEYNVPEQRRWIYDQECLYHHDLDCTQRQFFSYEQFLQYLESLYETGPEYWRRLVYLVEPIGCCKQHTAY